MMVFGMIEFGRAIMVQQILTNAAREGARIAVLDATTPTQITSQVTTYLAKGGISGATVTLDPATPSTAADGDPVTVSVSIPFSTVSWLPAPMFIAANKNLVAKSVMRRETVQ
jgi:Flp pilus assembly protein TadG